MEELNNSDLFTSPKTTSDVDVSIVLGENPTQHKSLLLLRFWQSRKMPKNFSVAKFYKDITDRLPRNGVTVTRTGGSSGLTKTKFDKPMRAFLNHDSSFPRIACAVKFVRHKLYYSTYYISPYTLKVAKRFKMSAAQYGGVFKVDNTLVKKYPFFLDFAEAKIIAAVLCDGVTRFTGHSIHPKAVQNELAAYNNALNCPLDKLFPSNMHKATLAAFAQCAQHTLVCHPVGYHLDRFKDLGSKLENKKCFIVPGYSLFGRGGAGQGNYVVAVLDW